MQTAHAFRKALYREAGFSRKKASGAERQFRHDAEQARAQAREIAVILDLRRGEKVLDIPCGGGCVSIEMASWGLKMTGVDLERRFLDLARLLAHERGVRVKWECRDVRDLPWRSAFDSAFCTGLPLCWLGKPGDLTFLRAVARSLKRGGSFLLQAGVADDPLIKGKRRTRPAKYEPKDYRYRELWNLLAKAGFDCKSGRTLFEHGISSCFLIVRRR